ncbi:MAG TPA: malto-oligosyltrehalose trehalohydrolase [Thermoanaerobaculia bacterium]|nr:malto-oligosyltrehalose trehalohydrolase [Thermoanaerobaculia bacterium]
MSPEVAMEAEKDIVSQEAPSTTATTWEPKLGAIALGNERCRFRVWAPAAERVEVEVRELDEELHLIALEPCGDGYFEAEADGVGPGDLYSLRLDGKEGRPDPASRFQPEGVHGPSMVIDRSFAWTDGDWRGLPLPSFVLYELHVGTFTPEGTFEAVIPHLKRLRDLGVTAIEIMPVAQFPGSRNWGYDGVLPFAVQNSYGGPEGLKRLVDACHCCDLAVVLDVVYNHFGPEGNYLSEFGPYFTDRYKTPWGLSLNYDGADCDPVRAYFLENALHWIAEYHLDGLRLDAVHAIIDNSERPFLQDLGTAVRDLADQLERPVYIFPESDLNTTFFLRPADRGGCGFHAQWTDDFHHSLHTLLTGEKNGYYQDFGSLEQMAKAMRGGFAYTGDYSTFRRRRHGVPSGEIEAWRHVVCSQNHDQTGNRMKGDRLTSLASFESLKLAAATVILSPFIPLLFMGEEYGEPAPFLYFISHSDKGLVEAVRAGRKEEFAGFLDQGEPLDPQAESTFTRSRLDWSLRDQGRHGAMESFYRELLRLRRSIPALAHLSKDSVTATPLEDRKVLLVRRESPGPAVFNEVLILLSFADEGSRSAPVTVPEGSWRTILDSTDERWGGPGAVAPETVEEGGEIRLPARSVVVLERG